MRPFKSILCLASIVGTIIAFDAPAIAFGAVPLATATSQNPTLTQVRYRGHYRGGDHRRWRRNHDGWRHRGGRRGYYGGHSNAGVGIGLATGAIIGGAIAAQSAPRGRSEPGNAEAYCSNRYKSYDPSRGSYLGYDGNRHPCP